MKQPTPIYKITIDGRDLTSLVSPRLISLGLTESRGEEADTLDLALDDSDGRLALPSRGAVLNVAFGWAATGLVNKGSFTVDEIEHAGAPDSITIRARSTSLSKGIGERVEKSWHKQALGTIVHTIAGKHKLSPKVAAALAKVVIEHIDQTNESDMSFLNRLAKRYDAVMNVKDGNLLFMPIGGAVTSSGKPLPVLNVTRKSGDQHRFHVAEREAYDGVRASWHSNGKGKRQSVVVGGETNKNIKVLPENYANAAEAKAAATAEFNRVKRGQATMSLNLALGIPELFPEMPVTLTGWKKPEIDGEAWLLKQVTHNIADGGYTCQCEFEVRDDPEAARHRSHFRKGGK